MTPLVIAPIFTVGLWIAAVLATKAHKAKKSKTRVSVTAVANYYSRRGSTNGVPEVVFDYPLPNGQWHRTSKPVPFNPIPGKGLFSRVEPGEHFTILVDPTDPYDIYLGPKFDLITVRMVTLYIISGWMTLICLSNLIRLIAS